jgi:hypothetical protein
MRPLAAVLAAALAGALAPWSRHAGAPRSSCTPRDDPMAIDSPTTVAAG